MLFDDVCFYCEDGEVTEDEEIQRLKEEFGIVRPIFAISKQTNPVKTRCAKSEKNMTSEFFYVLVSFILLSQTIKVVWIQTLRLNFFDLKANDLNVVCSSHF